MRKFLPMVLLTGSLLGWGVNPQEEQQEAVEVASEKEITPSARGCPSHDGAFIAVDFLYWKASETDLIVATKMENDFLFDQQSFGKWVRLHPNWEPGFRVGLGANLPYDGWDAFIYYTYYYNNTQTHHSTFADGSGSGFFSNFLTLPDASIPKVTGHYRLHYNVLDGELGRSMFLSPRFSLRPFVGVSAAWISRQFSVHYGRTLVIDEPIVNTPGKFKGEVEIRGIGPKAGFKADWWMSRQWKLFGNLAGAFLFGHYRFHSNVYQFQQDPADPLLTPVFTKTAGFHDSNEILMPWLQLQTGLSWGKCYNQKTFFSISAAWEANFWWDLPILTTLLARSVNFYHSNLSLNGLTLRFQVDF